MPPSEYPSSAAREDSTASSTARTSSIRTSRVGAPVAGNGIERAARRAEARSLLDSVIEQVGFEVAEPELRAQAAEPGYTTDSLQLFMNEAARYPLLTAAAISITVFSAVGVAALTGRERLLSTLLSVFGVFTLRSCPSGSTASRRLALSEGRVRSAYAWRCHSL